MKGVKAMIREYEIWFHVGYGPTQIIEFYSKHKAGSKQNRSDAISELIKRYGYNHYKQITIDNIVLRKRCG